MVLYYHVNANSCYFNNTLQLSDGWNHKWIFHFSLRMNDYLCRYIEYLINQFKNSHKLQHSAHTLTYSIISVLITTRSKVSSSDFLRFTFYVSRQSIFKQHEFSWFVYYKFSEKSGHAYKNDIFNENIA